jgi:hypothetical protein
MTECLTPLCIHQHYVDRHFGNTHDRPVLDWPTGTQRPPILSPLKKSGRRRPTYDRRHRARVIFVTALEEEVRNGNLVKRAWIFRVSADLPWNATI